MSLKKHIERNQNELSDAMLSEQRRRHLEDELESLKKYQQNNPEDDHDPTALELYCFENPGASECKRYEV